MGKQATFAGLALDGQGESDPPGAIPGGDGFGDTRGFACLWVLVRTRGSHRQFHHPAKPGTVTVSGQPGIDVPVGTLRSALKQAGLLGGKE